jgi:hypothetical protein
MNKFTLITGASQGIGLEFSKRCASLGRNVLLISLPNEGLEQTSNDIAKSYGVRCDFLECDLTEFDSVETLYNWVEGNGYKVDFLINNAGFGGTDSYESHSQDYIKSLLDLNVRATSLLTNKFLPHLKENTPSNILNVASMLAGVPAPYKALYSSSKTYVKNLTVALSYELKGSGIGVSVLMTGATPTNDIVKGQIKNGAFSSRITVMSAEEVARVAINKTLKGRRIITTSLRIKVVYILLSLMPAWVVAKIATNQFRKQSKKV